MRDVDFGGSARCERRSTRVARLVLEAVGRVPVGEVVTLQFDKLRFKLQLYLRHKDKSNLILYTDIIGDLEALRLERIQRALDDKCKKLESWAAK